MLHKYLIFNIIAFCALFLNEIKAQEYRVAITQNPPLVFTSENGKASGFFIELLEIIADKEGWKLKYITTDLNSSLTGLENGDFDIKPDLAFSEERAEKYYFNTENVILTWAEIYTNTNLEIKKIPDLAGKTIAVQRNDLFVNHSLNGFKLLLKIFNVECKLIEVDNYFEVFKLLKNNEADAGIVNKLFNPQNLDIHDLKKTDIIFSPLSLRFAASFACSDCKKIVQTIDKHLIELKKDKTSAYYELQQKYIDKTDSGYNTTLIISILVFFAGIFISIQLLRLRRVIRKGDLALKHEQELVNSIVKTIPVGLLVIDINLRIKFANQTAMALLRFDNIQLRDLELSNLNINFYNDKNFKSPFFDFNPLQSIHLWGIREKTEIQYLKIHYSPLASFDEKKTGVFSIEDITDRILSDRALKQSEEKYRRLFTNLTTGFALFRVIYDNKNNLQTCLFEEVNPTLEQILSTQRNLLIGKSIELIFPLFNIPQKRALILEMLNGEGNLQYEFFHQATEKYLDISFQVYQDNLFSALVKDVTDRKNAELKLENHQNHLEELIVERTDELNKANIELSAANEEWLSISEQLQHTNIQLINEISERKKIEQELKKYKNHLEELVEKRTAELQDSKERLNLVIQNMPILVNAYNEKYQFVFWNKECERVSGYSSKEILENSESLNMLYPNSVYLQHITEGYEKSFGQVIKQEAILTTKDGKNKTIQWTKLAGVSIPGWAGWDIGIDITERKEAEKALRDSERKLKNIFNSSSDAIIISGFDYHFIDVNKSFTSIFGYSARQVANLKTINLIAPEYRNDIIKLINELKKEDTTHIEVEIISSTNQRIPVELTNKIIHYGDSMKVLSVARDITERKQMERKILNTIIDTEEKERQRFAEDLHDELGPFLSGIKLYITELSYDDIDKTQKNDLINYLKQMINDAIMKTKAISNNLMPNVLFDYGINHALRSFCNKISATSAIDIELIIDELGGKLNKTLEVILYRIIIELINNTIKHANAKSIKILLTENKNLLTVQYSDNGIGFDINEHQNSGKGMGLRNILNRLKTINGKFVFKNLPAGGVFFDIQVDISKMQFDDFNNRNK